MILTGQFFLILSLFLLGMRTRLLSKVDDSRRIRLGLLPSNELYQGRMLRHLFSFEKNNPNDTLENNEIIKKVSKIDRYMILCFAIFAILFLVDLLS